jgi:hypothetical protein
MKNIKFQEWSPLMDLLCLLPLRMRTKILIYFHQRAASPFMSITKRPVARLTTTQPHAHTDEPL